ncbi:hypothetical protein MRX96_058332 [Rhipicephalus microplus]
MGGLYERASALPTERGILRTSTGGNRGALPSVARANPIRARSERTIRPRCFCAAHYGKAARAGPDLRAGTSICGPLRTWSTSLLRILSLGATDLSGSKSAEAKPWRASMGVPIRERSLASWEDVSARRPPSAVGGTSSPC